MMEKWKQKAVQMNFKRAVIIFIVTSLAFVIGSSAAVYGNFQSRISGWEKFTETDREYGEREKRFDDDKRDDFSDREHEGDFREREERDWGDISRRLSLTVGDLVLMAGCCIMGLAIGAWYWVLVLIAVYRKSRRMGVNAPLWTFAALFFNLIPFVVLHLYAMLKGTCTNCGRVRSSSGKFCDRCGNALKRECPRCGQAVDILSAYCGSCGKKLDEGE